MRQLLLIAVLLAGCSPSGENAAATANLESNAAQDTLGMDANGTMRIADNPRADERGLPGICDFDGWSADPDPAGLSVRAGPSPGARVLGTLPPPTLDKDGDRKWATGFHVVEARDGWFRIENAYNDAVPPGTEPLPSGWIQGSAIEFQLQTDKAFAGPSRDAAVVVTAWEDPHEGLIQFGYRAPSDCKGQWVKLQVSGRDKVERTGWVSGICGAQETTCDGVQGALLD